jgi:hypothetical protein
VGRCDHNTNPFALQSSRSEGCDETNACKDRVEDLTVAVRSELRGRKWTWGAALRLGTELHGGQLSGSAEFTALFLRRQFRMCKQAPQAQGASAQRRR